MASDYRTYLAAAVLSENRIVTYRLLSRALHVHVNLAKEMLFEFHQEQNQKKSGTVYASYIIAGKKFFAGRSKVHSIVDGNDEVSHIQSSPPHALSADSNEYTPTLSITLVREEDLEQVRKHYESISSVHVYCIGPSSVKDLVALSDANREIVKNYSDQDPIEAAPKYGTVINKAVRRRTGHQATSAAVQTLAPTLRTESSTSKKEPNLPSNSKTASNPVDHSTPSAKANKNLFSKFTPKIDAPATKDIPASKNRAPANRGESGGIFASFAKAKPLVKHEGTDNSVDSPTVISTPANVTEDLLMKDDTDDEEDTYIPPPRDTKKDSDRDRKSKKAREAALAQMMEEDDDGDPDLSIVPKNAQEAEELNTMAHNVLPSDIKARQEYSEVSDGRRRGRRRVMKKVTIKDEEGYLVTKEEPSWESFSEDEPVIKAKTSTPSGPSGPKLKKVTSRPGQGNIMSFFAKKP